MDLAKEVFYDPEHWLNDLLARCYGVYDEAHGGYRYEPSLAELRRDLAELGIEELVAPTHDSVLCFPILPQCQSYHTAAGTSRCKNLAVVKLYAPDGDPVPGGWECQECADAIIAEYHAKLGETWTTRPLHKYPDCETP